jgi:hypothetical protein
MEAIRITQKPHKGAVTIKLPTELSRKKLLEIIILPVEEKTVKKQSTNIGKLEGSINLNLTVDEIEQECRGMREQWKKAI